MKLGCKNRTEGTELCVSKALQLWWGMVMPSDLLYVKIAEFWVWLRGGKGKSGETRDGSGLDW